MGRRKFPSNSYEPTQPRKRIRNHAKSDNTLSKYLPKVKIFKEWMAKEYPSHIDVQSGELLLVTYEQLEFYLEEMMYDSRGKETDQEKNKLILPNSLMAYWAAIKHYYTKMRVPRILIPDDSELQIDCESFFSGYKKKIASDKQNGAISSKAGKNHFTMNGYKTVCELGFYDFNVDMWCFSIFCWNLVARGETVGHLCYEHIEWENDSLVIKFPKTKNDQTGAFSDVPKHVYSNPFNYVIDPLFALGMLVMSKPCYSPCLFSDSGDITHMYGEWLRSSLAQKNDDEQTALFGALAAMFGSHSNRKGAVTYLCNAIVSGVSIISIFMRAGWSISKQHNPYFHQGDGGDHYCGRSVAGLNVLSYDFAVLPPRFDPNLPSPTIDDYRTIIPGYDDYPPSFKGVIPYAVASSIHQLSNMQANVDSHKIFRCKLFTSGFVDKYKNSIILGRFSCDVTHINATGIPAHLVSAFNLEKGIGNRLDALQNNFSEQLISLQHGVDELRGRNINTINTTTISIKNINQLLHKSKIYRY